MLLRASLGSTTPASARPARVRGAATRASVSARWPCAAPSRPTYGCIAERVGLSKSTVARTCQAAGIARLPALEPGTAPQRFKRSSAGELLHIDTKKLARFVQPGHRVTGDRTRYTPRAELKRWVSSSPSATTGGASARTWR
jgi:hypothetical protein